MDKEQNKQKKGEPLPGTSKDPTGQVISDQGRARQDQESQPSGGSQRSGGPQQGGGSGSQKGS